MSPDEVDDEGIVATKVRQRPSHAAQLIPIYRPRSPSRSIGNSDIAALSSAATDIWKGD